jgi:hypothetical protein
VSLHAQTARDCGPTPALTSTRTAPVGPITRRPLRCEGLPPQSSPRLRDRSGRSHPRSQTRCFQRSDPPDAVACAALHALRVLATAPPQRLARTEASRYRCPTPPGALAGATQTIAEAQPMPTRNIRNDGPGNKRLLNNAGFVVFREPATSARSRDHLQPAHRLRLKRMVKHRHKPTSDSEIERLQVAVSSKLEASKN